MTAIAKTLRESIVMQIFLGREVRLNDLSWGDEV